MLRVKERGVVGRVAYRPLSIGVQEVVPKDVKAVPGVRHPSCHGHAVPHHVMGWDVPRPHCGVVGRASPILSPPDLDLAVLVFLDDGEGRGREDVSRDVLPGCPCPRRWGLAVSGPATIEVLWPVQ